MGILNVTPDSFADASPRLDPAVAVDAALRMEADQARISSTSAVNRKPAPARVHVSADVEPGAAAASTCGRSAAGCVLPLSVDTMKAEVARAAIAEGAGMINDVSWPLRRSVAARAGWPPTPAARRSC